MSWPCLVPSLGFFDQLLAGEHHHFSSTMLVHAPCDPGQRIDEDWPLEPKWDYPKSKVRTEELIRARHGDIPYVLLRIAGVYDDSGHSIPLANQMQRIYERWLTSHVYPGDTTRGQAFLHLEDLVGALLLLVRRRAQLPRELTLLLGEPETLSYEELQRSFGRLIHGEEWETWQIPKAVAKTGAWLQDNLPLIEEPFIKPWMIDLADDHYELDIRRARSLLGWEPKSERTTLRSLAATCLVGRIANPSYGVVSASSKHSLRDTLPKMVAALKEDPLGWYKANKLEPPSDLEEKAAQSAGSGHER